MIVDNHSIELYVNNELVDLSDIDIRINKTLFDVSKLTTSSSEYSFTFNIPITNKNGKIFDNINALSKKNKFSSRYDAVLYCDSKEIFNGALKVTSIDNDYFHCNLYIPRLNTIETIFGDSTLDSIKWYVPFEGINTINQVNADMSTKYFFPLVAYSLFNKVPRAISGSGYKKYTDKKWIDDTNRFYFNSFIPSLNLTELVKKCFEYKNLQARGDFFDDAVIKEIYLSNSIGNGQDPLYNYGNPKIGEVSFNIGFQNYYLDESPLSNKAYVFPMDNAIEYYQGYADDMIGGLDAIDTAPDSFYYHPMPYAQLGKTNQESICYNLLDNDAMEKYNNVLLGTNHRGNILTRNYVENSSKMLVNGGIQIPADGYYEITIDGTLGIPSNQVSNGTDKYANPITASIQTNDSGGTQTKRVYPTVNNMPVEFQLLRFNANTAERESLCHNTMYTGMYPNESKKITDTNGDTYIYTNNSIFFAQSFDSSHTISVDTYNNADYICGFKTDSLGCDIGYLKNGNSFNSMETSNNIDLYNSYGYNKVQTNGILVGSGIGTDVNANTLKGYTQYTDISLIKSAYHANAHTKQIIYLNKNDVLCPYLNIRRYEAADGTTLIYMADFQANFKIRAVAPQETPQSDLAYTMNSKFDYDLNLGNFCSNEKKISDFINDVLKAFNITFEKNDNVVYLNKAKTSAFLSFPTVDLDNRTHSMDATVSPIDLPSSLECKFSIDTEEEGFYRSVPNDKIMLNDWKDYGDYGSKPIILSNADDATAVDQTLGFSYCWYNQFKLNPMKTVIGSALSINVPIIGKSEWWIEGYKYEEMARNDGRSLKPRFWFRSLPLNYNYDLPTNDKYNGKYVEWYHTTLPKGYKNINGQTVYLNYNSGKNSLMYKYFNVDFDSADDEVEIDAYLSAEEYYNLSHGGSVIFNSDVYRVEKMQGYDPSGRNTTRLYLVSGGKYEDFTKDTTTEDEPIPLIKNYIFTTDSPTILDNVSGSFTSITIPIDSYYMYDDNPARYDVGFSRSGTPKESFIDVTCNAKSVTLNVHGNTSSKSGRTEYVMLTQNESNNPIMFIVNQLPFDKSELTGVTSVTYVATIKTVDGTEQSFISGDGVFETKSISGRNDVSEVIISTACTYIEKGVLWGCKGLTSIKYEGTVEQWENMYKSSCIGDQHTNLTTVTCTDGTSTLPICWHTIVT